MSAQNKTSRACDYCRRKKGEASVLSRVSSVLISPQLDVSCPDTDKRVWRLVLTTPGSGQETSGGRCSTCAHHSVECTYDTPPKVPNSDQTPW